MPYPLHFYITFSSFLGIHLLIFSIYPFLKTYSLVSSVLLVKLGIFSSICPIHTTSISHFSSFLGIHLFIFSICPFFKTYSLISMDYWSYWRFFPLFALFTPLLYHIFPLFWVYTCLFSLYAHFSRHVLWFLWIIGHTGAFFLYMPIPHIPFCFYSLFLEEQTNLYLLHFIRKPEKTVQYKL